MSKCNNHNSCIDLAITKAEMLCLKRKLKFTKLRKNILRLIWESHIPLKAYDILERLRGEDYSAKPITVYRILDFFLKNNIIHKLEKLNVFMGCNHPGDEHNCYFIICNKCHMVEEACEDTVLQSIYSSLKKKEFLPSHVTLEITGTCHNCLV